MNIFIYIIKIALIFSMHYLTCGPIFFPAAISATDRDMEQGRKCFPMIKVESRRSSMMNDEVHRT
jgi:hypothetical protein